MNRTVLLSVIALVAIGIAVFALTRPEPMPQERLSDAVEDASEAAQDAVKALSDAASETGKAVSAELSDTAQNLNEELNSAATSIVEGVTQASDATRNRLNDLLDEWRASGIVSPDGIDFDAAIAAVANLDMEADTKSQLTALLAMVRDAPGAATAKLKELETALSK